MAKKVRNLPDGRVEAVFKGPDDTVEKIIDWCHEGSPRARLTNCGSSEC